MMSGGFFETLLTESPLTFPVYHAEVFQGFGSPTPITAVQVQVASARWHSFHVGPPFAWRRPKHQFQLKVTFLAHDVKNGRRI